MESEPTLRNERESLEQLRDYVSKAVDEIVRLRAQNTALARRLSQLEAGSSAPSLELAGTTDPEKLRTTISGFIDAIDDYLDGDSGFVSGDGSDADNPNTAGDD